MEKRSKFWDNVDTDGATGNLCLYGSLIIVMFVAKACVETFKRVENTVDTPKVEVLVQPTDNAVDAARSHTGALVTEGVSAK